MLIGSFALSGHSDCIVLDLLIAGSEMLLLLFHMDGYSAKRDREEEEEEEGEEEAQGKAKPLSWIKDQRLSV